jgi:hypothetical protein
MASQRRTETAWFSRIAKEESGGITSIDIAQIQYFLVATEQLNYTRATTALSASTHPAATGGLYALVAPQGPVCILVTGNSRSADLEHSWFWPTEEPPGPED